MSKKKVRKAKKKAEEAAWDEADEPSPGFTLDDEDINGYPVSIFAQPFFRAVQPHACVC